MKQSFTWDALRYWDSGEHQVIQDILHDMKKSGKILSPRPELLFEAMEATPYEKVRVCIVGQDPYPNPRYATGLAFSIPDNIPREEFPPTLTNLFREYTDDLHLPFPTNGNLLPWAEQGVFLWNAIPSCEAGKSLSHNYVEWHQLTREVVETLSNKGIVFVFLGGVARDFAKYVDDTVNEIIETSHPSPRGSLNAKKPFFGSRIFTRTNDYLCHTFHDKEPIDWRL